MKKKTIASIWGNEISLLSEDWDGSLGYIIEDIQKDIHKFLEVEINDGDLILDIGANVGVFAIAAAKKYPRARILAIEPMQYNVDNLMRNISNNKCDNIVVMPTAVMHVDGSVVINHCRQNAGSASVMAIYKNQGTVMVPCYRLENILSMFRIQKVKFMKMDIEGAEYPILEDFKCWDHIERAAIDMHRNSSDVEESLRFGRGVIKKVHETRPDVLFLGEI